eukprot:m.465293 g.465293  ORF g.465293 m.465293 type:complete len:97 (+) comp20360_c4_seq1:107-397(+)
MAAPPPPTHHLLSSIDFSTVVLLDAVKQFEADALRQVFGDDPDPKDRQNHPAWLFQAGAWSRRATCGKMLPPGIGTRWPTWHTACCTRLCFPGFTR